MNREIVYTDLGLTEYQQALDIQRNLFDSVKEIKIHNRRNNTRNITPNYFLFTEHPHVYTLGKSGKEEHLLLGFEELAQKGVQFYKTDRGGDITYHGPGQIVAYPILDLDNFGMDIIRYMRNLEEVIIHVLKEYDIKGERIEGETGVWIDAASPYARKICAMGVRTSKWVTMHGLALNVSTDLKYFDYIIPCGIRNKGVTSMEKELGYVPDINRLKNSIVRNFEEVFGAKMTFHPADEFLSNFVP